LGEERSKGFLKRAADWLRKKDRTRKKTLRKKMGRREAGKAAGRALKKLFE